MYIRFKHIFLFLIILVFGLACSNKNNVRVVTSIVDKIDFVDKILVSGTIDALKTTNVSCPRLRTNATVIYLIPEGTHANIGDTLCRLQATSITNEYKEALNRLERTKAEKNKVLAGIELDYLLLKAQVEEIKTATKIALLDSARLEFATDISKELLHLRLKKAKLEKQKVSQKLKFLKIIKRSEIQKLNLRIRQAENNVKRRKGQMDQLIIISKTAGIVIYSKLWSSGTKIKKGDIVWDGTILMQIPDMSKMQVNLSVNESNYKRIQIGQKTIFRIDAFSNIVLKGEIQKKAPVGIPVSKNSQVKYFEITASIDSVGFSIKPGLSVSCDIILENFIDTIVIPQIAIHEMDSIQFVYVLKGEKYIQKNIEIAYSNNNMAVIKTGLTKNEILALNKPEESLIQKKNR